MIPKQYIPHYEQVLDAHGFTKISVEDFLKLPDIQQFKTKLQPSTIKTVWGLAMRAGKWADTWVIYRSDLKPFVTLINGEFQSHRSPMFVTSLVRNKNMDTIQEKLSASQPAAEWIHDFVYSKNPKFAGKTKKERIQMALGAYYAAQKNEDVDISTLFKPYDDSIEYDPEQLAAGIAIEMEHTDDEEIATIIAKHHLAEDPEYYIKLASCVEKGDSESKMEEGKFSLRQLYAVVDSTDNMVVGTASSEEAAQRIIRTSHLPPISSKNKDKLKVVKTKKVAEVGYPLEEEYGAGFEGTDELRKKYIKDTPGQKIQHFKTNMKQKSLDEAVSTKFIDDLLDAANQVQRKNKQLRQGQSIMIALKDMNSTLYSDITGTEIDPFYNDKKIPAMLKHLNPNWKFLQMDEAYGESWVVYNKDTKAKISKSFKMRKAAYDYAAKNGGVVYSAEYYFDHRDDIHSGKLVKEESNEYDVIAKYDAPSNSYEVQTNDKYLMQMYFRGNPVYKNTYVIPKQLWPTIKRRMKNDGYLIQSLKEAINIRNYNATSEKSQFGGYRPKVVGKDDKTMYLGDKSYKTPEAAKDHAEEYLKQYASGISPSNIKVNIKESSQEKSSNDYSTWIIKPREGGEPVKIKAPDESSAIEIALGRKPSQHELDFFNFHYVCICEKVEVSTARNMKIVELATKCYDETILKEYVEQQYKPGSSVLEIKESFKKFTSNK